MTVHLVLYANGEPFTTTKQLTIDTIRSFTTRDVIIHDYNLDRIKKLEWYPKLQELYIIKKGGRRDGSYNAWKACITYDVYNSMGDNDILYYVDSSKYYSSGFTESIDKLCDIVEQKGIIAGSVGINVKNNSYNCCDNIDVWKIIIPTIFNVSHILNKMHVLNSWFIMKKNHINTQFINEWVYYTFYKDTKLVDPLVTYHHTGDQSIFNILVLKYNLPVFFDKKTTHNTNKNKNHVLRVLNNAPEKTINSYFIKLG